MVQKLLAEGLGSAMLLIAVVGSGIMGETLADGNTAVALLANAVATGAMLFVLITVLGPISGAHFNPIVTLAFWLRQEISLKLAICYIALQVFGGVLGVWFTHVMYDLPILQFSNTIHRSGYAQWSSEVFASFGLLFVIFGGLYSRPQAIPALVALYITGAYFFTASTSFANPAVTIARLFSDTFAGIYPGHVPMFILMQLIGLLVTRALFPLLFVKNSSDES